ncbi:MAG: glycosyltransferase [Synergistaceae bacterium]|jgi:glycosyltransferase involved in cell wall biosynthesis|nr:glycosyltransferase [Synergistaceae bacterium]
MNEWEDESLEYKNRRKYRLAFLLRDLGEGGAARSALRLANGLARDGQSIIMLLFAKKGPLLREVDPKVEVVDLKGSFLLLLMYLRAFRADFLLPVYTSMRALLARLVLRASFHVILSQRNMFTLDRGPVQTRLRFLRCRLLYPLASACICISRGVAEEMRTLRLIKSEKIRVIYNPVLTDELCAQMEAPLDHPWFKEKVTVVLGVGRLGVQKDFATLIRAFGLLAPRRPELRLLILGEGKQRAMLEKLVRKQNLASRVSLPGYVSNPFPYMKRAALFVMTSRFEGFGNVAAEALACGCSVVSTDCKSGPAEILDDGKYGYLAKTGDASDVARAIEEALKHPLPVEKLKKRAAFFSQLRAVKEYERLFDDLTIRE